MALKKATFGAGCFWCVEAVFQRVKGVEKVESGYSGGDIKNPSYREVCSGRTGHAEVIHISFDPDTVAYSELLDIFFKTHNPTTLNQQGADVGTQYRSVIFYHNEQQKALAENYKEEMNKAGVFDKPVVTEITPFEAFYRAEEDHQNYYNDNPSYPYCTHVIEPKLNKFQKEFREKLKS